MFDDGQPTLPRIGKSQHVNLNFTFHSLHESIMTETAKLPSTLDEFIADEWAREASRLRAWTQRPPTGVSWSGMEATPYKAATNAQILAAATRRWEYHTMFAASPSAQLLSALSRIQNAAESARAAYARGFGDRAEVIAAVNALTDVATAQSDALDALKVIAEEHLA